MEDVLKEILEKFLVKYFVEFLEDIPEKKNPKFYISKKKMKQCLNDFFYGTPRETPNEDNRMYHVKFFFG